jgi:predicted component of type VI protein secretion system
MNTATYEERKQQEWAEMVSIEGKQFMNFHGYSDVEPYEIVRVISAKTVEIRQMEAQITEESKKAVNESFQPGGFVGHFSNQQAQEYTYTSNPENKIIRARLGKKGWKSEKGTHWPSATPRKFYDYNF